MGKIFKGSLDTVKEGACNVLLQAQQMLTETISEDGESLMASQRSPLHAHPLPLLHLTELAQTLQCPGHNGRACTATVP